MRSSTGFLPNQISNCLFWVNSQNINPIVDLTAFSNTGIVTGPALTYGNYTVNNINSIDFNGSTYVLFNKVLGSSTQLLDAYIVAVLTSGTNTILRTGERPMYFSILGTGNQGSLYLVSQQINQSYNIAVIYGKFKLNVPILLRLQCDFLNNIIYVHINGILSGSMSVPWGYQTPSTYPLKFGYDLVNPPISTMGLFETVILDNFNYSAQMTDYLTLKYSIYN
jgi:hypothetical protein